MGEELPSANGDNALVRAMAEVPAGTFKPTVDMLDFVAERIRHPGQLLKVSADRCQIDHDLVYSWFQDEAFLDWFQERIDRSDQFWLQEIRRGMLARAMTGKDFKAMKWALENLDRQLVRRQQAAASAQAAAAARVTVTIVEPRDPGVRDRDRTIVDAEVIKTSAEGI